MKRAVLIVVYGLLWTGKVLVETVAYLIAGPAD